MGRFWKLDHTADLAVRVEAETIEDLFITFAKAMFESIIEGQIRKRVEIRFEIKASDVKELLMDWLRELIYRFETQGFIPAGYSLKVNDNHLIARTVGDEFDPQIHTALIEIKTPTYHRFSLEEKNGLWQSTVIFDV
ncbi:MAG TPA: archease [bacterium (Candidatus Stahlbacteria)]|nr:archease [Candidatus Stahlbacteria bacterium]